MSVLMLASSVACAQPDVVVPTPMGHDPDSSTSDSAGTGTLASVFAQINEQDPIRRAGLKASVLRQVQRVVPIVVIVENADSYLHAIENWEGVVRFPVLWDDGTSRSREDIARFVRSFDPEHVIKLNGLGSWSWIGNRQEKQDIFEQVLSKAINQIAGKPNPSGIGGANPIEMGWEESLKDLADTGIVGPGIVITDVLDTAWPGALAVSAARLQPISFVTIPDSPMRLPLSSEDGDALERAAEHAAKRTGRSWDAIGDDIDMVTLAMNTGTMIKTGGSVRARLSTTDRVGRTESNGAGERWAWCGQIIGNESQSVYQAMCALFLEIDQGFVWDGYSNKPPWSAYDGTKAADTLKEADLDVELYDQPRYTLEDWKYRMVRPVGNAEGKPGSSGLFLMNSKGMSNMFQLPGGNEGQGKPGDIPLFDIPMAMHIVHSFSLAKPAARTTVGGRFLERGVYVYAGSVDEPFLGAFVQTPMIANRLIGKIAFATAVHYDNADVWKITVIGDPLVTFGSAGQRLDGGIKIAGAIDVDAESKQLLKDQSFANAMKNLVLLGNDSAVARLAIALMKEQPEDYTSGAAMMSIPSLFREGEFTEMLNAYDRLSPLGKVDDLMQDILWLSSPYLLARSADDPDLRNHIGAMLRANIRENQSIEDAETLAMFLRDQSVDQAVGVLEALRPTLNENQRKRLDKAIARVRK